MALYSESSHRAVRSTPHDSLCITILPSTTRPGNVDSIYMTNVDQPVSSIYMDKENSAFCNDQYESPGSINHGK